MIVRRRAVQCEEHTRHGAAGLHGRTAPSGSRCVIEGRVIVCVASSWDYDPTSKHHIMGLLSQKNDIVWINYHGTRRPRMTGADLRRGCSRLIHILRGVSRVSSSIVQVTPLVIPGAVHPLLQTLQAQMLIAQIRRAVQCVKGAREKPLQVWSFAPDAPYLVGRLGEECFLYYCVDEYSEFDGVNAERIASAEAELVRRAHLVVTSSEALFESKRAIRPDTVLMLHGVDYDHFASAWRAAPPRPADLASVPPPIFGFFGAIQYWIDVALIAAVARLRPRYSFVLIGDCLHDVSALKGLPNVHLLGRRPNADLPSYCAAFAAGLIPFKRTALTRSVNPIKMYEYLAAGLPVVSTSLPEVRRFDGPITTADVPESFAAACDRILATNYPGRRETISKVVERESWHSKVEQLSAIIQNRVLSRASACPAGELPSSDLAGAL